VRGDLLPSYFPFAFSKPQVTGDVSPGPTTLNRKRLPIEVTVIGLVSSFANLLSINLFFYQSTNCDNDNIFVSSLIGNVRKWIDAQPSGSFKTPEDLEQAFKGKWCKQENVQSFYSQYIQICRGSNESIRDFNDRFNLLLKKIRPNFNSESAILQHYLDSLEGTLQFTLKH
jgi:hypothetical protein